MSAVLTKRTAAGCDGRALHQGCGQVQLSSLTLQLPGTVRMRGSMGCCGRECQGRTEGVRGALFGRRRAGTVTGMRPFFRPQLCASRPHSSPSCVLDKLTLLLCAAQTAMASATGVPNCQQMRVALHCEPSQVDGWVLPCLLSHTCWACGPPQWQKDSVNKPQSSKLTASTFSGCCPKCAVRKRERM